MRPLRVCVWTGESIAESFGFRKALEKDSKNRPRDDELNQAIRKSNRGCFDVFLLKKDLLENGWDQKE